MGKKERERARVCAITSMPRPAIQVMVAITITGDSNSVRRVLDGTLSLSD